MSVDSVRLEYSKSNPYLAHITDGHILSKPGSAKDTRHFVVNITGSGLSYEAGDSLGVFATNRETEVDEIIALLGASGEEMVTPLRETSPVALKSALTAGLDLDGPTRKTVEVFSTKVTDTVQKAQLESLLDPEAKEQLDEFLHQRNFVDFLAEFPTAKFAPQEFVVMLRRLNPRLYSIASSPRVYPNEIHLTVAVVRYTTNQRDRVGVCSTFVSDRAVRNHTLVPVFVSHSHFKPPQDQAKDCIMVGPGTGVAPFRAFVQDRVAAHATGRNWLFFGDQKAATDYLYEEEWAKYLSQNHLSRLDIAFSRDQERKIYVQDRMRENASELWSWIKGGAHFYVCGDAKRMAKDVDAALHEIIATQGGMDSATTTNYIKKMKKDKRYQRDVY